VHRPRDIRGARPRQWQEIRGEAGGNSRRRQEEIAKICDAGTAHASFGCERDQRRHPQRFATGDDYIRVAARELWDGEAGATIDTFRPVTMSRRAGSGRLMLDGCPGE
jgi:hypothetical protein